MRFLCDVEKKGDEFINTGDLVMIGTDRSYYFVDRLGDTFRFVGQSTSRVSNWVIHVIYKVIYKLINLL